MFSALSERSDTHAALAEAAAALIEGLGGLPDVVLIFTSAHHAGSWSRLPTMAAALFGDAVVAGCSGAGVIGDGRELEQRCGLSLFGMRLNGLTASCHHVDANTLADADEATLSTLLPGDAPALTLIFADPLSTDLDHVLPALQRAWPGSPVVGGMASGSKIPGGRALFADGRCHRIGAVILALRGPLEVRTVVSQGCRPIGQPMLVTRCKGRMIQELGGERPVAVLRALYNDLDPADQAIFRHSLFAGIELYGDQERYEHGDFQIRRIRGMDPNDGSISLTAEVQPWQVVQFHLRDPHTATSDLRDHLSDVPITVDAAAVDAAAVDAAAVDAAAVDTAAVDAAAVDAAAVDAAAPDAALMFTCTGRGLNLFGRPDHDTDLVRERFPQVAMAGLFCNGEIGPVGERSFVHGSATVVVFLRQLEP